MDCGRTWMREYKPKIRVIMKDNPCPRCGSIHVGSHKHGHQDDWRCHDCGKNWTKQWKRICPLNGKLEEIKELYKIMTQKEIADKFGVHQTAIQQFMKTRGIKARSKAAFHPHKISETARQKLRNRMIGNIHWHLSHDFPNREEQKLIHFFKKWNFPFEYVGDGSFKINGKCPDFVWKERKLIVEFFGELWHKDTDEPNRIEFFKIYGWNCLVIWGREIVGKLQTKKEYTYKWEYGVRDKILRWMAGLP
jgi:ribosomal protein L37AE/L43A